MLKWAFNPELRYGKTEYKLEMNEQGGKLSSLKGQLTGRRNDAVSQEEMPCKNLVGSLLLGS